MVGPKLLSLDKLKWLWRKDGVNPVKDHLPGLLELNGVQFLGRIKLVAMTAPNTLGFSRPLVDFRPVYHLRDPLPRVFKSVCEEDISGSDLVASVIVHRTVNSREIAEVQFGENMLAIIAPVLVVNKFGANAVHLRGSLVETKFCAVLVGPGTARIFYVDLL